MRSNIIERTLNFKINDTTINIKFHKFSSIIVTSIYKNNHLTHQFGLEPNKFWNYEEFKKELQYIIYKYITVDLNLPKSNKFKLEFTHNVIMNSLSEIIDNIFCRIDKDGSGQDSNQIIDEDTNINLLFDFINLKQDFINLKEKYDGQKN